MKDTLNSRVAGIISPHLTAVGVGRSWQLSRTFSPKASLTAHHGNGKRAGTILFKKAIYGCLERWIIGDGVRLFRLELQRPDTPQ